MGLYINPQTMGKLAFLQANAQPITKGEVVGRYDQYRSQNKVPVVVADNHAFLALAVCYKKQEAVEFTSDPTDRRPKTYWVIPINKLTEEAGISADMLHSFGLTG